MDFLKFKIIMALSNMDPHMRVLGSVVAVAFQITFCAEMHAYDVFLFLKNYF